LLIEVRSGIESSGNFIRRIIDFFYPPFRRFFSIQFFRYGVTGTSNLVFGWFTYFFIYNFLLEHRMVNLGFVTMSSHVATMVINLPILLTTGFFLQKYVTFSSSSLRGRVQLFRYLVVFMINLVITYTGLKLLVDQFKWYPTLSNMAISVVNVIVSYFSQKYFTFRINPNSQELEDSSL
jgi:putative flippase GtrA